VYKFLRSQKTCISRGFIFAKQTRYGIKQKSIGPKINENFTRKRKLGFREDLFSRIEVFQIFREDLKFVLTKICTLKVSKHTYMR